MAQVEALVQEVAEAVGVLLYDLELVSERGGQVLRVTLDKEGSSEPGKGVSIDECAAVSRELGQLLDVDDPIAGAYRLEVSSPGVERTLRTLRHYRMAVGEKVMLFFAEGTPGPAQLEGVLEGMDDDGEVLQVRKAPRRKNLKKGQIPKVIPIEQWELLEVRLEHVHKGRTVYDFR